MFSRRDLIKPLPALPFLNKGPSPSCVVVGQHIDAIAGFDPQESNASAGNEIIGHLYETLVAYDVDKRRIVPLLAVALPTQTGSTWTFRLRADRRFASGATVTVRDVVESLRRAVLLAKPATSVFRGLGLDATNV